MKGPCFWNHLCLDTRSKCSILGDHNLSIRVHRDPVKTESGIQCPYFVSIKRNSPYLKQHEKKKNLTKNALIWVTELGSWAQNCVNLPKEISAGEGPYFSLYSEIFWPSTLLDAPWKKLERKRSHRNDTTSTIRQPLLNTQQGDTWVLCSASTASRTDWMQNGLITESCHLHPICYANTIPQRKRQMLKCS
jgi:hypothetical protein